MHLILAAALLAAGASLPVKEMEYADGALAYQALVEGDLARAERQLLASRPGNEQDVAWLLNYGQLLARQGRVNEARAVFRRVAEAPDNEIVLSSGAVIGSRDASRLASRRLAGQSLSAR